MLFSDFRYFLVFRTGAGESAGHSVELEPAIFEPAVACAYFYGIRKNIFPALSSPCGSRCVPRWSRMYGEPFIEGFDVEITGEEGSVDFTARFPLSYLQQQVLCLVDQSISNGVYHVCAVSDRDGGACDSAGSFSFEEVRKPLDLRRISFDSLLGASSHLQDSLSPASPGTDMPVFISEDVLAQSTGLSQASGELETGGLLVGFLCRGDDENNPSDIFAVITSQIHAPVEEEDRGPARLRFTPDTWSFFRDTLTTRNRGELMLGWWHSHPFINKTCDAGNVCAHKDHCNPSIFLSASDLHFQRVAFSSAFSTALVIGGSPCSGMSAGLFGWRWGTIVRRDFYILNKNASGFRGFFEKEDRE